MVEWAVVAVDGDLSRTEQLSAALAATPFHGPRGPIVMSAETYAADGPLYLRQVRRRRRPPTLSIGHLAPVAEQETLLAPLRASPKTGWPNAYLCV